MRSASQQSGSEASGGQVFLPDWLPWLQAGLTAMLAVLFLVMVGKLRQQSSQLRGLQERVQGLENSRALERTSALEEQLRSTAERLQALERSNAQLEGLSSDNARLRQELQQLRKPAPSGADTAEPSPVQPTAPPPLPPVRP
jgi:TolA-binding protein